MFAEDKVATRRRSGMVRACRKDKITLRKVKHEMNARVAISRRRDMVRAGLPESPCGQGFPEFYQEILTPLPQY